MKIRSLLISTALCMVLLQIAPSEAHHSRALYDSSRVVTIEGKVKEFHWTNPHCYLLVTVPDGKGVSADWNLEGGAPTFLVRNGWKRDSLKPGMPVVVRVFPMRDGSVGGSFAEVQIVGGALLKGPDPIDSAKQRKRAETDPI